MFVYNFPSYLNYSRLSSWSKLCVHQLSLFLTPCWASVLLNWLSKICKLYPIAESWQDKNVLTPVIESSWQTCNLGSISRCNDGYLLIFEICLHALVMEFYASPAKSDCDWVITMLICHLFLDSTNVLNHWQISLLLQLHGFKFYWSLGMGGVVLAYASSVAVDDSKIKHRLGFSVLGAGILGQGSFTAS